MATIAKWYYLDANNVPTGPLSTTGLVGDGQPLPVRTFTPNEHTGKLDSGEMTRETLCWCDGRETWQCAEDIAEIQAALGALQSHPAKCTIRPTHP